MSIVRDLLVIYSVLGGVFFFIIWTAFLVLGGGAIFAEGNRSVIKVAICTSIAWPVGLVVFLREARQTL